MTKTLFKSVNYLRRLQRNEDYGTETKMEFGQRFKVNRGLLIKLNYKLSIFFRGYFFLTKAYNIVLKQYLRAHLSLERMTS